MYSRILVPVDGSETSRLALEEAVKLALPTQATIILLHVAEDLDHCTGFESPQAYIHDVRPRFISDCQSLLENIKVELGDRCSHVETVLTEKNDETVAEAIARQAELLHADLIILGTHGRRGFNRLMLGSNAEQVARTAPVPVMLVRGQPVAAASEVAPDQAGKQPEGAR